VISKSKRSSPQTLLNKVRPNFCESASSSTAISIELASTLSGATQIARAACKTVVEVSRSTCSFARIRFAAASPMRHFSAEAC
jgi:hypothetical protein